MLARIYQPAKSAMTSGQANTKSWVLEYAPEKPKRIDPLMGWTGSSDMNAQVRLRFESREAAVAYARQHCIPFQVIEPKRRKHVIRPKGYGGNFATERCQPWTH
jgi:NADH dehydrogenase